MRYSELDQINRENVKRLKPVWTLPHGRARRPHRQDDRVHADRDRRRDVRHHRISPRRGPRRGDRQGALAVRSAQGIIRSRTGRRPAASTGAALTGPTASPTASGGSFTARRTDDCSRSTRRTASSTRSSAREASCNLREGLDPKVAALDYGPTSAPAVWNDTIIVGVSCGEGPGIAAPGDIRAFDVRTGKEVWRFRTVPGPGEFGNETWKGDSWKDRGGANAWGGFSVDARRGLVFAGLGSAAFDFYGGDRHGDNLFANCTIALDAQDGQACLALSDAAS